MSSDRVTHLIRIDKDYTGLACTPVWVGKKMTTNVEAVTCQSCFGTDFYKKKLALKNKTTFIPA